MAISAIGLFILLGSIDRHWALAGATGFGPLGGIEPEGARAFLSTVAGATMTVTGVVFSITIVALSLASQQFGPRLLDSFMRDQANHVVFGSFIATYLYCLLVLRSVEGTGLKGFVPQLSLAGGFLFAVLCVGVLIFFIHHMAESIQVMTVIASVSEELELAIIRDYPAVDASQAATDRAELRPGELPGGVTSAAVPVRALRSGYVQAVNAGSLLKLATEHDLLLRLEVGPGNFVTRGAPLVSVWSGADEPSAELVATVAGAFIVGSKRSAEQDIEHLINQLVEIAVRAISIRLLEMLAALLPFTCSEEQRRSVLRQAAMIEAGSRDGLPADDDRRAVRSRYVQGFEAPETLPPP